MRPCRRRLCNESGWRKRGQSEVECAKKMTDYRQYAPATVRNRDFILDVLRDVLPTTGVILEIASGSGEHVVHFARNLPNLGFQPSDPEPEALLSVAAWVEDAQVTNVRTPIVLDASQSPWPIASADGIICINMVHISPWDATIGLITGAAATLPPGDSCIAHSGADLNFISSMILPTLSATILTASAGFSEASFLINSGDAEFNLLVFEELGAS
jgi:Protein of unknown function (DUF938)